MIGNAYKSLNDLPKCATFYRRALDLRKQALEPPHKDIALCLNALGQLCGAQGKHERAAHYHRESLAMYRELFGNRHSTICRGLTNLACELYALGDREGAKKMFQEAHGLLKGDESRQYAGTVLGYLARIAQDEGNQDENIELLQEALQVYEDLGRSRHPYAGRIQLSLGKALAASHRDEEAEACFVAADSIFKQHYEADHPTRRHFAQAFATFKASRKNP